MTNGQKKWQPAELKQALAAEIQLSATKSSGPGGQNVNKTESAVVLKWNIETSNLFSFELKMILQEKLVNRINKLGEVVIKSQTHRDQISNKRESIDQLVAMILQALVVPTVRKKTKPKYSSVMKRLNQKNLRSEVKKNRSRKKWD
ncbi:MAG: alternative ribosome rescue aminoacyl-tRNA hydrolase ArfB [Pseudobdellovibrionaceae bacterium]|jgi:ribosome-associated protein